MNKHPLYAAVLSSGLLALSPLAQAQDAQRQAPGMNQSQNQPGVAEREAPPLSAEEQARGAMRRDALGEEESREIASNLADVLKSALDNDLESVVDQLDETDRERIGARGEIDEIGSDETIEAFKNAWNQQYGNAEIEHQNIPYSAKAMGPDAAQVTVPAAQGKQTQLQMTKKGAVVTRWRIDVSDTLSADQLKGNLQNALQQLATKTDWPQDPRQGATEVAAKLFAAFEQGGQQNMQQTQASNTRQSHSQMQQTGSKTEQQAAQMRQEGGTR